jgi:sugar-specific transcriptional regulator TrmB
MPSMNKAVKQNILKSLFKLGIETDVAQVYLALWINSPMTVVQLSRHLDMGRNKIYRILDDLKELNLVSEIEKNKGSEFTALDYSNLRFQIEKKKENLEKAEKGFKDLLQQIPYLQNASEVSSNVIHYTGLEGLKQVNWNLVHTEDMYRVYEVSRLSQYLEEEFAEKLRREWLQRQIYSRDLTNDTEIEGHTNFSDFTKKYSEYRHIDLEILKIETEIYIYNNVVTVLKYDNLEYNPNSIFCVEIHNEALANMQKQIYDIIWKQAEEFEIVDDRGKRVLTDG